MVMKMCLQCVVDSEQVNILKYEFILIALDAPTAVIDISPNFWCNDSRILSDVRLNILIVMIIHISIRIALLS